MLKIGEGKGDRHQIWALQAVWGGYSLSLVHFIRRKGFGYSLAWRGAPDPAETPD